MVLNSPQKTELQDEQLTLDQIAEQFAQLLLMHLDWQHSQKSSTKSKSNPHAKTANKTSPTNGP